jgi:anaerobic selenocysteine-containing dehydrogenase
VKTICPLDCYDACSVIYEDGKLKGDKDHPFTKGYLCPSLNSFLKQERIENPTFNGKTVTMDEALDILATTLKKNQNDKSLFFKGSGNMGRMQDVTALFFSKIGFTFTKGSLCDGAGEAGIIEGRGVSMVLPLSEIQKSEVVVVWGRDISTTNSHMMQIIEGKTLIVVDPVKTDIAKKADIHVQLRPRSDFFLALLWARFAFLEEMEDLEFIENFTEEFDYFKDFIQGFRINDLIKEVDLKVSTFIDALELMRGKKVSFLVGVGVQKYLHGDSVLRAIDSFAAVLGLFGKEGCGVSYLGDSGFGFSNPFVHKAKRVAKPTVDFKEYKTVFIQGANPMSQMPDSNRVKEGLDKSEFIVYFGLYANESSKKAHLVIPAKTFLEKDDVRLSYGSEFAGVMPKQMDSDTGISEYELTKFLFDSFGFDGLKSEQEYITEIISSNAKKIDGYYHSDSYDNIPYSEGFYTDDEKFIFMDEVEDEKLKDHDGYFLITSKPKKSINSQFSLDNYIYISPNNGFKNDDLVKASSKYGSSIFKVKISDDLRDDSVKICSGAKGVNLLTPSLKSNDGDSAVFQEVKIKLEKSKKKES